MGKISNKFFGELSYDCQWEKEDSVVIGGNSIPITTIVEALPGEKITEIQEKNYQTIKEKNNLIEDGAFSSICEYVKKNYGRSFATQKDVMDYMKLQSVLYKQNGKVVALFSIPDDELGVGVELIPAFSIGPQDLYL